jgi:Tol biopolymer transport system component
MVTYGDSAILTQATRREVELVRYDLATRRFVPYLNGLSATEVAFSPDGKSVVYSSYPKYQLWRASIDGTGPNQLVKEPGEMRYPAWSPDDRWIAFASRLDGQHLKIFLVPADGSDSPKAISPEDREQDAPSWSPDGRQFCFGDVPEQFGIPDGPEALHIYDLTTRRISDVPDSKGLWSCRWSPDGRYLAAVTLSQRPEDVMRLNIFDRQTNVWRALPNVLHVNTPSWSHDSKFISYDTEGRFSLRRVRLADNKVEEFPIPPDWGLLQWSGLAPDDSPLLLRDVGTRNVYALKFERR